MGITSEKLSASKLEEISRRKYTGDGIGYLTSDPYYGFLMNLTKELKPDLVVELGTASGNGAAHFAQGGAKKVVSIDILNTQEARDRCKRFPNIELWKGNTNSPSMKSKVKKLGKIDILFIDTEHTSEQAWKEYEYYSQFANYVLYDDIILNEMRDFWDRVPEPKLELNHLHTSGFGISW